MLRIERIAQSSSFKRAFKKRVQGTPDKVILWRRLRDFVNNPNDPRMRVHKLAGKLQRACTRRILRLPGRICLHFRHGSTSRRCWQPRRSVLMPISVRGTRCVAPHRSPSRIRLSPESAPPPAPPGLTNLIRNETRRAGPWPCAARCVSAEVVTSSRGRGVRRGPRRPSPERRGRGRPPPGCPDRRRAWSPRKPSHPRGRSRPGDTCRRRSRPAG